MVRERARERQVHLGVRLEQEQKAKRVSAELTVARAQRDFARAIERHGARGRLSDVHLTSHTFALVRV